jgi:general secretion pathway protein G
MNRILKKSWSATRRTARQAQRGFTLLELMVVLAILALLGALVGPAVMEQLGGAKVKTTNVQIKDIERALDMYKLGVGRYPTTAEGIAALVNKPGNAVGWTGPYLKETPKDGWGHDFQYTFPAANGGYEVKSLGADNAPGGDGENADISSIRQ